MNDLKRVGLLLGASALGLVLALAGPGGKAAAAAACAAPTKTWIGPANGDWNTAGFWSPAGIPGPTDDVCINAGASVFLPGSAVIHSVESAGTLTIGGSSGSFEPSGTGSAASRFDSGGQLTLSSTPFGSGLSGAGEVVFAAGSTLLWNAGESFMQGTGVTTVEPGATLTINDAASSGRHVLTGRVLNLNGTGTWSGDSKLELNSPAVFNIGGTFIANNDGLADGGGLRFHILLGGVWRKAAGSGITDIRPQLLNNGLLEVDSGVFNLRTSGLANYDPATHTLTGGRYVVANSSELVIHSPDGHPVDVITNAADITLAGAGAQILDEASSLNVLRDLATTTAGGKLTLLPALTVSGAYQNSGLLSIGDNGDNFAATTTFTQTSTGTLGITIGGTIPGTNLGHLQAGGAATFAGALALNTDAAFTPSEGEKFTVANYASKSGKFKTTTGVSIPNSTLAYKVAVGSSSILLTAMQAADLKLSGTAPASVPRGSNYDYVWTIDNLGPGIAKSVVLTDALPTGVVFVSASPGCSHAGQKVTCKPPNLNSGASVPFTITVTAPSTPGTVKNTASVKTSSLDLVPTNNKKTLTTTIT